MNIEMRLSAIPIFSLYYVFGALHYAQFTLSSSVRICGLCYDEILDLCFKSLSAVRDYTLIILYLHTFVHLKLLISSFFSRYKRMGSTSLDV